MAATAGTLLATGVSGKTYAIDLYVPDAVATQFTFNGSGLAASTSNNYIVFEESVVIKDIVLAAAPTAVGGILQRDGAQYANQCLRWNNQLDSVQQRPALNIPVKAGVQLGILQF